MKTIEEIKLKDSIGLALVYNVTGGDRCEYL